MEITGAIAFVTGGASGIGFAIGEALHAAGARVVLADIDLDGARTAATRLGERAMALALDVTDRPAWEAARKAVEARFGTVSILVNNAGIGPDLQPLDTMPPGNFDRLVAIKLTGTFNGIQTFVPEMRQLGTGHVVNTASMAGLMASARLGAYTAAKFAVVGLSEVLRAELAPAGIGVSVLCPGLVATNLAATTEREGIARPAINHPEQGMDARLVGEMVLRGIRENRLYIITHGQYLANVSARADRLAEAFADVPSHTSGSIPLEAKFSQD